MASRKINLFCTGTLKLCNNSHSRYCPKLELSGIVRSTANNRTCIVPQQITSKFNNLIYLITCKVCKSQHEGQTMNFIQKRFQKYLNDISHCRDLDQIITLLSRPKAPPMSDYILPKDTTQLRTFKSMFLNSSNDIPNRQTPLPGVSPEKHCGYTGEKASNPLAQMPWMALTT